jgi:uncharacterized protein YbjT (DUF2867 family)
MTTRILVTGAGGVLGGAVVHALLAAGARVRGLGRRPAPDGFPAEWREVDLLTGHGVASAFEDVKAVVHCATNPQAPGEDMDVLGRLIDVAEQRRVHLVHVGIAGIEQATASSEYYRTKAVCEARLSASRCPFTIVRATQLHPFVEMLIERLTLGPFLLTPEVALQPVDPDFVAAALAAASLGAPQGRMPDLHGPETLRLKHLAASWLEVRHIRKRLVPIPAFGPLRAFSQLREVRGRTGGRTWRAWLNAGREPEADGRPVAAIEGETPSA